MTPDPSDPGRILRRADLAVLRDADARRRAAEREASAAVAAAEQTGTLILSEARQKALREATRAAAEVIARAESLAEEKMRQLEPELARLIARTVREIVGRLEPEEAAYLTALNALRRMRDHRGGRIYASPDLLEPIRRAAAAVEPEATSGGAAEVLAIVADDDLPPGRAILSSDRGHAEIGHRAVLDAALRPWEAEADD